MTAKARYRLPLVGNLPSIMVQRDVYFEKARRLGPIVELQFGSKPHYLVNDAAAIGQLLAGDNKLFDKGHLVDMMRPFFGNGVGTCPHSEHREQRRMLQPAFHRPSVADYLERAVPDVLRPLLARGDGDEIDGLQEMTRISLSVMSRFTVDGEVGDIETEVLRSLPIFVEGLIGRTVLPDWFNKLPLASNKRWSQAATDLRGAVLRAVASSRRDGKQRNDLLSMLLATTGENGQPLTDKEICDQIINMLAAGSETTATTMAWFFHVLSTQPELERDILSELDTALEGRTPTAAEMPKLVLMNYTILETLRLYHPFWFLGRRSTEQVTLAGESFPPGTEFIYSIAALHRDPTIYPDALAFKPMRWAEKTTPRQAFIPFATGVRKCMGDNFALVEMALIFATVLQRFRLEAAPGQVVKRVARAAIQPDPLKLFLRKRKQVFQPVEKSAASKTTAAACPHAAAAAGAASPPSP